MKAFRPIVSLIIALLVCDAIGAQQFRKGTSPTGSLAKAVIEWHLQSIHPRVPSDSSQPTPGKYLLQRAALRSRELRARIEAARSTVVQPESLSVPSAGPQPGIQFRPALPAGSLDDAVVAGDFNRDGNMDFVVANAGTNDLWIYLGKGDGTFQLPRIIPLTKGLTPVYLATADLRGNGILDLIVAEFDSDTVGVLLGNGDGTFGIETDYTLPDAPSALAVDDFNRDGHMDVAAVMVTVNSPTQAGVPYIATLFGDGSGSLGSPVITLESGFVSTAQSLSSGDVNGDGLPDLLITGPGFENSQIYLNAGNGTFTPGQIVDTNGGFNGLSGGVLADVNGDGCPDAVLANDNGFVSVFTGDCSGDFTFETFVPMGDSTATVTVADMNGDGHPDIVATTFPSLAGNPLLGDVAGNMLAVAFGDGSGHFTPARDYVGTGESYSFAIADFNGDGHPDVVSASPDTDTATVWTNDGSGGFGFPQGEWIGFGSIINNPVSGPSFADLNGDGKPDVALLEEGYQGEYWITSMLNDGTGRFAAPRQSDTGVSSVSNPIGDYRLGDFRNTGHLDFVAVGRAVNLSNGSPFIVFAPGNGDGSFGTPTITDVPGADGTMAVGDFNGDGKLDFLTIAPTSASPDVTGWDLNVFLGNGDGTFRTGQTVQFNDTAQVIGRVFVGDFNRDGKLDVLVFDTANGYWTTASNVWEFFGNGDGTFQPGQEIFNRFEPMTMADVNGDSILDIVKYDFFWPDGTTQTYGPAKFTTYLDQPSGAFTEGSSYAPYAGTPLSILGYQFGDPSTSSIVADLNGDGKPDEIAFQQVNQGYGDEYGQILAGNGDGTFTPTYDIFDFKKDFSSVPKYAHKLDSSSTSDLLEIDSATSSMSVFKGGPAPSIQLELDEAQVTGSSGCGWVFLNVPSSSDTSITLSSSISGVILPATVTVPAGSLGQQFCYSLASGFDWHQVFDVRAQLGTDTEVAYASQAYTFGFSEAISVSGVQYLYPSQSTPPITVSLTSSQGYSSTVQLSCEGLTAGESCSFGSDTLNLSPNGVASTTVVVNTSATTPTLITSTVVIVASDANVTTRQSFSLRVVSLVLYAGSGTLQATSPGTVAIGFGVLGIPPYSPSCLGLPLGVTCSFSQTISTNPSNESFLNGSIAVASGVAPGSYPFTIQVVSGPETASVADTLDIGDFSLLPPASGGAWAVPGQIVNVDIMLQEVGAFQAPVSASCTASFGGSCSAGSAVVGQPLTLSITVPSNTSLGTYNVTVTATDNSLSLTHSITFPFYVADFNGSLSMSSLTIAAGGTGSLTATVDATTGFAGTVSFACTGAPQLSCSFSPPNLQPTASQPQTTTLTISAASLLSANSGSGNVTKGMLLFFLMGSLMIGFLSHRAKRVSAVRLAFALLSLVVVLFPISCGGGSGGGGIGGGIFPQTFAITITSTISGTSITRTLGTVDVTVTRN